MTTIERINMAITNLKILNSRRKNIRVYRYIRTYGSLPLLQEIANKKKNKKISYFIRIRCSP
jgi:hypothetical protein